MQFTTINQLPEKHKSDCIVVGVFEDKKATLATSFNATTTKHLNAILAQGDMTGKVGESSMLYHVPGIAASRLLLIGCGKKNALSENQYIKIIRQVAQHLRTSHIKSASLYLTTLPLKNRDTSSAIRFAVETLNHQLYEFNQFKSDAQSLKIKEIALAVNSRSEIHAANEAIKIACAISGATARCRNLANMPSNICTPNFIGKEAQSLAKAFNKIKVKVLGEKELKKMGMNLILAVGQGSQEESKLIEIHYQGGSKSQAPIALVGKGVTFDSGGLCIKSSSNMFDMKMDMSGAATMLSVIVAAAELALPLNLVAVLPCVENMPSGIAFKPSDIIKSFSGKSVEIIDTDAEGRLILADALTHAQSFKPKLVIDAATLTGAVVIALGYHHTGLISNDEALCDALLKAGKKAHDLAWPLPIDENYQEQIDSKIADVANLGNDRSAGSITAACFLARFIKEGTPWAHLDIAGTAMQKSTNTGRPVALLVQYLIDAVAKHAKA